MNTNGESSGVGTSVNNSDSNSSSSSKRLSSKRGYSSDSSEGVSPTKRKTRTVSEGSSHSDENQPDSELAPLEFDVDERTNSFPESDHIRGDAEGELTSGNQHQDESKDENNEDDDTLVESTPQLKMHHLSMDCESESLLVPVIVCSESSSLSSTTAELSTQTDLSMAEVVKKEHTGSQSEPSPVHDPDRKTTETSDPHDVHAASPPSSDHSGPPSVTGSPPYVQPDFPPSAPEPFECPTSPRSPSHIQPNFTPSAPEPFDCPTSPPTPSPHGLRSPSASISDSASFWRSCNAACCTQAIFTGFIKEMNDIFKRIQSEEASQEDYDRASAVMEAWGNLADIVTKQQEEIQRKQAELEEMSRAMKEVVSALKR